MIKLTPNKTNKRHWKLDLTHSSGDKITIDLDLLQFSLTNRFETVQTCFEEFNELVPEFSDWYFVLMQKYIKSNYNFDIVKKAIDKFIYFSEQYIKAKNIDFSSFVNRKKTSKTSILFEESDIEAISLASTCLKIYSIFSYDINLKVPDIINKFAYNKFVSKCVELNTTDKIFQLIRSRNYRSSTTDSFMWTLIKLRTLEDPETSVMSVFNFFMTNLIPLLNVNNNPVHFLVKVVDDNIRWMMMEIYREKIIYDESYSGSEDVYGTSAHNDMFHICCCNDLIAKAAKLGLKLLEEEFDLTDEQFLDVKERLEKIQMLDPSMRLFTLPIISKVFDIPYIYLKTAPPKHIVLIGILIYLLSEDTFVKKYPVLSTFLLACPCQTNAMIVKSSYKLRDVVSVMESKTPIFGLNSRKLKYDVISPICGILSSAKKNLVSAIDGTSISKITYLDLEQDSIDFYTNLYSNGLKDMFEDIQLKFDQHLV